MTLAQALVSAVAFGIERLDAQLLMLHALTRPAADRAWLLAHDDEEASAGISARFLEFCRRRRTGEPLAYIVGRKEFFGLELEVDPRVLIPRPETELLVEWTLECLPSTRPRLVDLGTGSGAIALAIKKTRPDVVVEAVDASPGALELASENARALELDVKFRQSSWLTGSTVRYNVIVSNPPYVREQDPHLAGLTHEPLSALIAGADGLDDLRTIVGQAPAHLAAGGWLLLEHGWDQANAVRCLLQAAGFQHVGSRRDLAGIERCSGGQRLERG